MLGVALAVRWWGSWLALMALAGRVRLLRRAARRLRWRARQAQRLQAKRGTSDAAHGVAAGSSLPRSRRTAEHAAAQSQHLAGCLSRADPERVPVGRDHVRWSRPRVCEVDLTMRLQPWHIIVLVVVLILLFGAKRLPDAARSLGRSHADHEGRDARPGRGRRRWQRPRPKSGRQPLTISDDEAVAARARPGQRVRDN